MLTDEERKALQAFMGETKDLGEYRRAMAVANLEHGVPLDLLDVSEKHAQRMRREFRKIGPDAFKDKRHNNKPVLLTPSQRRDVLKMLQSTTPNDHGYTNSPFWSTTILARIIEQEYGVVYASRTSYYLLFRESKFTFHMPGRQYEKADPSAPERWKREHRKHLDAAFADPRTVILCEDEMVLTQATTTQKVWIPQGTTPGVIELNGTKHRRSVYGFLNLKTGREHAFSTEQQTMYETAKILSKIRKHYPTQKILIIWDGAGWHRGSVAQAALEKHHMESILFPAYSPELNPQEHVWKQGRSAVTHNRFIPKIDPVTKEFVDYLNATEFNYSLLNFRSN